MAEVVNLFGEVEQTIDPLRNRFVEPPFTVLDGRSGDWQMRKARWKGLGIKSEEGRSVNTFHTNTNWMAEKAGKPMPSNTSIFDPYLCEVMYKWFCPDGGTILDPFAGGSVRGVVAGYLDYKYTGIELRPEQVASNEQQITDILKERQNNVKYICGDSNIVLDDIHDCYDMIFSCPPYADLEVYSDLDGDISNMSYSDFLVAYQSIITKACDKLKVGGYAVFVVGEVRDKKDPRSTYYGFVPDTVRCFMNAGMAYYNEAILLTPTGSAPIRAAGGMRTQKLCKVHQNVLVFKK